MFPIQKKIVLTIPEHTENFPMMEGVLKITGLSAE
jgi:hypothetical protein